MSDRILAVRKRIGLINTDIDKPSAMRDEPDLIWACCELREIAETLSVAETECERLRNAILGALHSDLALTNEPDEALACRDAVMADLKRALDDA